MQRDTDEDLVRTFNSDSPDLEMIRRLVSEGANVNAKDKEGFSVLWHAVASCSSQKAVVELLVECGANLNEEKDDLLYTACETVPLSIDAPDIIAFLLSKGANPNVMADTGKATVFDIVEHFQSCFVKWSKEGREGSLECLARTSIVLNLLASAGGKRAEEMVASKM